MTYLHDAVRARFIELLTPFVDEVGVHPEFADWVNFDQCATLELLEQAPTELLSLLVDAICPNFEDGDW